MILKKMENRQNTYGQQQIPEQGMMPPQGQMVPPPMQRQPRQDGRRQRKEVTMMGKRLFPKWLSLYPAIAYVAALMVVTGMYASYSLPWYYMLSGVVAIGVFFLYGKSLVQQTSELVIRKEKNFEKRIFIISLAFRVAWMLMIYNLFMEHYGDAFGFENADTTYYDELGQFVAGMIERGDFHFYDEISKWSGNSNIDDMGYGIYVGFVYWLTGNSIIAVRLMKCLISAGTVVLIYRLAKRNFGEQTARIAAIFVALWPNFWYYCGTHLKETEMVFLAVLFVEQADQMLRSRQFTAWKVIPVLLIAAAMFTFRTPLGLVALIALVFSVVMSSTRVISWGKRIIVGFLVIALIGVVAGNRIQEKTSYLMEQVQNDHQEKNMEWRTKRENGNVFAKYAGSAVFAPLIFSIPFPTMVRPFDGQELQQLLNGGNFVKNIVSFFLILALAMMFLSGKWREHLLPLSFLLGYLLVLTMSEFAQSERFHQPVMPFEFMFAVYGLSVAVTKPKYKRWFMCWCVLMFVAAVAWNWFKLKGRGIS